MAKRRSIEIQADRVGKTACPKCGNVVGASSVPAFTTLKCDKCQTKFAAPGKLGGFILLKELGRGQMGVTYKAFEKVLGRYVAIKVMRAALGGDPKRVKDFMAEGRALASLDHPNAVRIYSIGQEKGQPYIAMELVNGRSVGYKMGPGKKIKEARALEIATGVARALKAAGAIGLIHSDVKPDNVVLDEKGRAKLVDFGIARFGPGKLEADAAIGTPYYVAPEQVQRGSVDLRTDIYSLGATLYHMLSGSPPFPGTDLQTVLNARLKKAAPSLMKTCRGLHMETVHVVAKMLQTDPARRYQNYDDLLKDLRRACWASGAELTQEADDAPLELASKGHGPSPTKMLVAAAAILAVVGVVAWAVFFRGPGTPSGGSGPGAIGSSQNKVADPVFFPRPKRIADPTTVEISCGTEKADIHYTTDGKEPTQKTRRLRGKIRVAPGTTLRARAFREGMDPSEIVNAVYGRDSVVVEDVVKIRLDAQAAWREVEGYGKGQGFDERLRECEGLCGQADELYKQKVYASARKRYEEVLRKCKSLKTLESARKTARSANEKADNAIRQVGDFRSAAVWKGARDTSLKAKVVFEQGGFLEAYELWGSVVVQIDQQYKALLPTAQKSYERALSSADPKSLQKYARREWRTINQISQKAAESAKSGRFGLAVTQYKEAEKLIASALAAAKKGSVGEKRKAAIKSIADLMAQGQAYKARDALQPMLKASPQDNELKKLDQAVRDAMEIKIYLQPNAREENGGLVMPLRLVPPGTFKMGSPDGEAGREKHEVLHDVTITQPFYVSKVEVTRRQFEHFVKATRYKTAPEKNKRLFVTALVRNKLAKSSGKSWKDPGFSQGRDHPVVCVSWDDANEFCKWLTKRAGGMTISLPTEAQWEYACRQGGAKSYSFGADPKQLHRYGNYSDKSSPLAALFPGESDKHATTAPVHAYKSADNHPHLYDMHGNVAEWCSDRFGPYAVGENGKPVIDPVGINRGEMRVVRGGSWAHLPSACRSASRGRMLRQVHSATIGFRVIATGKRPDAAKLQAAARAAGAGEVQSKPLTGRAGLGTWETHAEFKDFKVTRDGKELLRPQDLRKHHHPHGGKCTWARRGSSMEQKDKGQGMYITYGDTKWSNYTVEAKARQRDGMEGFRVVFADNGKGTFYVFSVGGHRNSKHLIEKVDPKKNVESFDAKDGKVKKNQWYSVKVVLADSLASCYLDGKLICTLDAK